MDLLFEPMDFGTVGLIEDEIRRVLVVYEPRIEVTDIRTEPNFEDNGYEVELSFKIIGRKDIQYDIEFFLERTR